MEPPPPGPRILGGGGGGSDAAVRPSTVKTVKLGDTVGLTAFISCLDRCLDCSSVSHAVSYNSHCNQLPLVFKCRPILVPARAISDFRLNLIVCLLGLA